MFKVMPKFAATLTITLLLAAKFIPLTTNLQFVLVEAHQLKLKKEPAIKKETAKGDKNAQKDQQGNFTHNNKGNKICPAFNRDQCTGACPQNMSHQCSGCLMNSHSQIRCGVKPLKPVDNGKGGGKGAGKKKGKKGRG
jgi:hypothetical protein